MKRVKALLASPALLIAAILVFTGAALGVLIPASEYIVNTSKSTTDNFNLVGLVMVLLAIAAVFEALFVVRLVWGRGAITGEDERPSDDLDLDEEILKARSMKVTGTKKALVFGVFLGANIMIFDMLGAGVLVTATRRYHVLTQLRSDLPADREAAVQDAIQLVGDEVIAEALGKVLEEKPSDREWIAYTIGVRRDVSLKDSIADLLSNGSEKERAAAAVALARMKDPRLFRLCVDAWDHVGDFKKDLLIAMGMLGKVQELTSDEDLAAVGDFLVERLEGRELDDVETRLALWVLGQMETPAALDYMKGLLSPETDTTTLCITIEALGKIGEAASCDNLMDLLPKVDKQQRCEEVVASDFTGREVLLCGGLDLVKRILREVANIGDDHQKIPLERLAEDKSYPEDVRKMAREIAFQMRFRPATSH